MAGRDSINKKLSRVRPPRVHIEYEVQTGSAIENRDLPFVVGVVGDFSGKPEEALPKLKDRKFVAIDRDNFDDVMKGAKPRLAFKAENKLQDDDSKIGVELKFSRLEDFEPEQVVRQVEPLKKLLEIREQLTGLLAKTDGNDRLTEKLEEILKNTELMEQIKKESGPGSEGESNG